MKRKTAAGQRLMVMDACVLIDFLNTDPSVLRLVKEYVGPVHVVSAVIEEVDQIRNEEDLIEIGLIVVEPDMDDAYAAAGGSGATSYYDRLCLLTAKKYGFTCITNDKNLRKACELENIRLLWGLELLAELHKAGGIPGKDVEALAVDIRKTNPKHITAEIVARFTRIVRKQEPQRSKR